MITNICLIAFFICGSVALVFTATSQNDGITVQTSKNRQSIAYVGLALALLVLALDLYVNRIR